MILFVFIILLLLVLNFFFLKPRKFDLPLKSNLVTTFKGISIFYTQLVVHEDFEMMVVYYQKNKLILTVELLSTREAFMIKIESKIWHALWQPGDRLFAGAILAGLWGRYMIELKSNLRPLK